MNKLLQLRRQRTALVEKARHLLDLADGQERKLTDEESRDYDRFMSDIESLETDIARREELEAREAEMGRSAGRKGKKPEPDANLGLSDKDIRNYSLLRAIRAMAANDWRIAPFEREISEAVAQRLGVEPQGFFVPDDVTLRGLAGGEQRDLTVGTDTAGGHTVSTDLLAASFIELLRNLLILRQAGATFLAGLVGDIAIPRQTGGATAYWVAESGAPTESQQAFDQVALTPKTVGAFTDFSRKLLKQSSLDIETFVRGDLAQVVALAIDLAGLHGSGASNQPTGVAATAGIGSVAGGTNGAAPDWDDIVDLETEVAIDNAAIGRLSYITNANVRGKLKKTFVDSGSNAERVWDTRAGNTPLNGYMAHVTNQAASNLTKGSGTNLSAIFFGNWADLIIGMWGSLDILVDPYTHSTSGTVRVVALQDVDVAVRHAQSFAAMLDADTS